MRHSRRDYINYKNLTIEPISNGNAVAVGVILLIISLIIGGSDMKSDPKFESSYMYILIGMITLSRIIFVPWIYKISKKVGKDEISWTIFGIIIPAITLIILGFSDLKVKSKVAMNIVNKKRTEFRNKTFILKHEINDNSELDKKIDEIKKSLNKELQNELKEYYA